MTKTTNINPFTSPSKAEPKRVHVKKGSFKPDKSKAVNSVNA
jgi:hypothetical protein